MSQISYDAPMKSRGQAFQSQALGNYKAIVEQYQAEGHNIISEGVQDILNNRLAFGEYLERLTEGCDEGMKQDLMMLAENTRLAMLQESSISGANPISALSLPMLRVGYPKLAIREGLPTEPVEQPKFKITTKRPYIRDENGNKQYLPAALTSQQDQLGLPQLETGSIAAANGSISNYDLLAPISKSAALGDEIDARFSVVEVVVTKTVGGTVVTKAVEFKLDTNNNVVSGTFLAEAGVTATFLGSVNREKGLLTATVIAAGYTLTSVKIVGFVSSEANNSATQVGFDIDGVECVVGTAQPIESPINIQHMTDVMHMYQVDATLSHLETMTTVLAHATDIEGLNFIKATYQRRGTAIAESFDVTPPANFANGDAAWREQIKLKIDRLVTRLQMESNIYSGHAVVFCNPLDAQVIGNVKWVYAATEQVSDVAVDYKVGNYISAVSSYTVLQSPYFAQGEIFVVYVPSDAEHKTLVYFPYSFNTVRGAASPNSNSVNVPTIQMIKRHLFQAFTPMVAKLTVQNNGV